jgi:hypothetical protein
MGIRRVCQACSDRYGRGVLRFRQAVIAARDLDAAVAELRAALPLEEPYADPGVSLFGLRNAVMALGDTFVEVVSPIQAGTAAGRFLDRRGDGPYMAMFQTDDLPALRERADAAGVREVWAVLLEDIAAVHLHPGDIGGAIVSLDQPAPPESWRWAGPEWTGGAPLETGPGETTGLTLAAADPDDLAERWTSVLGTLELDRGRVDVQSGDADGIAAFHVTLPDGAPAEIAAAGTRFVVTR